MTLLQHFTNRRNSEQEFVLGQSKLAYKLTARRSFWFSRTISTLYASKFNGSWPENSGWRSAKPESDATWRKLERMVPRQLCVKCFSRPRKTKRLTGAAMVTLRYWVRGNNPWTENNAIGSPDIAFTFSAHSRRYWAERAMDSGPRKARVAGKKRSTKRQTRARTARREEEGKWTPVESLVRPSFLFSSNWENLLKMIENSILWSCPWFSIRSVLIYVLIL